MRKKVLFLFVALMVIYNIGINEIASDDSIDELPDITTSALENVQ